MSEPSASNSPSAEICIEESLQSDISNSTPSSALAWNGNRHRKYARALWVSDQEMLDSIVQESRGVARNGTVIDLGCGLGHVAEAFLSTAARCVAVDSDDKMLKQARCVDRIEYIHSSIEHFSHEPADVVVSRNVAHYTGFDVLIAKATELLRSGGLCLVCQAVPPSRRARGWHDSLHDMLNVGRAPSIDDLVTSLRLHNCHAIRAAFHFHRMNVNKWVDARVESQELRAKVMAHHLALSQYPEYEPAFSDNEIAVTVRFAIVTGIRT